MGLRELLANSSATVIEEYQNGRKWRKSARINRRSNSLSDQWITE